ncbi:MAG: filamentous hemagglutinin N-terminal domain-containing protein [Gallionella sp.]|nr:filamentous hemagglutinin N-terminal domain-containing protein [Gallionella sp.]
MKRHASMNRVYRLIWSQVLNTWVCCAENAKGHGKSISGRKLIAAALALMEGIFLTPLAMAGPVGGQVSAGAGTIAQTGVNTTITQSTQNLAINWQDFSIAANESVRFIQPSTMSVALNRVIGQNPSQILGSLSANGQVFVLNPNGVLFGSTAQVNVGGLVASTLNLSDADLMAGNYSFGTPSPASGRGMGRGAVVNQGNLTAAPGGYIALLAPEVRNEGVISATLGTALLAAGDKVTLNLNNGSLLSYSIDQGALQALADNKQLIQADGGRVFMSAKAADALSSAVVNNTGIIQARTIQNVAGVIKLIGDMQVGTVNVGGTLDASVLPSPAGGRGAGGAGGGFIETSAAHVKVANDAHITTAAPNGLAGTWLIDPVDFTVAATGGDITGAALSTQLDTGNVIIQSLSGLTAGNGDIFVNDAINKTGTAVTSLTLQAQRNININSNITSTGGALNINLTPGAGGLGGTSGIFASVNTNGGVINFTNGIMLSPFGVPLHGSILNSTLTSTDALPSLFSFGGVLDGVTLGSNLSMGGYSIVSNNLALANGVTLNLGNSRLYFNTAGAQSISTSGAATINMAGGGIFQQYNQAQTLTLGTGLTVNGWGTIGESSNLSFVAGVLDVWTPTAGNASLVNNGVINANVAGQTLSLGKFGSFTNAGSINLSAGTLDLAGTVTTAGLGSFTRTTGTSVNLSGTLDNTGTTVDIGSAGLFQAGGLTSLTGTILNGTLTNTDAVPVLVGFLLGSGGGTLDGITLGSNLNLSSTPSLTVKNNLILANGVTLNMGSSGINFTSPGAQSISTLGTATINVLGGGFLQLNNQAQTLTLGSGLTVNGWGAIGDSGNPVSPFSIPTTGNAVLVNNGIINANVVGHTLSLGKFGSFTNAGSINLSAGSLNLAGNVTTAGLGNFTRTAGTSVVLSGTLDNTGTTVDIGSAGVFKTGGLTSLTGTILNGTLKNTDAVPIPVGSLLGGGATLDGVTLGSNLSTSYSLTIKNNLILADGVTLNLGNSRLYFNSPGAQSISTLGAATINMAGGGILQQYNQAQTLTLGTGLTVNGWGSVGESGNLASPFGMPLYSVWTSTAGNASLVNNGIINANVAGQTLSLGKFGNFTNTGSLNLSAGTLDLGGTFTTAGLGNFTRTAGTSVVLSGTLDNTGATVDIGSAGLFKTGGLTSLTGTILNGTLKNTDAVPVVLVGSSLGGGATLDGVTLGSNLITSNNLIIKNNLILADGVTLNLGNSRLYFNTAGAQSISTSGAATINMAGGGLIQQPSNQIQTLTLGSGLTLNGLGTVGGLLTWSPTMANISFVNNGIINANAAYSWLYLGQNGNFSNNGTVNGSNAGVVYLRGGGTHSGTFNFNAGAVLNIDSGIHHFTNAHAITGNGSVMLGFGPTTAVTIDGAVSIGLLGVYGATGTINGALNVNNLNVNGGTLNLNGTVTPITNLFMNSGTLNSRGSLSCTGIYNQSAFSWLNVGGNLDIAYNAGLIFLGNINVTGNLTASASSDIYQAPNSSLTVGGSTALSGTGVYLINTSNNLVGMVSATGSDVSLTNSLSGLKLGNINVAGDQFNPKGNFSAIASGTITQAAGSKITVTGDTTLTADNGIVGAGNVKYGIALANAGNNFMGAVNATGSGINLLDSVGGLQLGNINATGTLTALSRGGAITQAVGTSVNVAGTSTLIADNAKAGVNNFKYGITLNNASNDFRGKVSAIGNGISLTDINALMATVTDTGNTAFAAGGNLNVWSNTTGNLTTLTTGVGSSTLFGLSHIGGNLSASGLGAITQDASGINVAGTTSLTGSAINLSSSTANDFVGAVSATGTGVALLDGVGGLQLGNINATGKLTALSRGGAITQAAGTGVNVTGTSTLIADNTLAGVNNVKYGITLNNASNDFRGKVSAIGNGISLTDKNALIVAVTDTGNTSFTTGGNLTAWSNTTGNLTTTQTAGYTQFGTSSIGGSLVATSPVSVTRVTGNIITVANSPTTTSNPNVTINGVVGVPIP